MVVLFKSGAALVALVVARFEQLLARGRRFGAALHAAHGKVRADALLFVVTAADVAVDVVAALPFFEMRVGTGAARARAGRQSNARRGVEIDHTVLLPVRYDDGQSVCDPSADGDQHQL